MRSHDSISRFKPEDFPILREFLRGYLHQDWNEEYRSACEALEHFCLEAGVAKAARLADEWHRLIEISRENMNSAITLLSSLGGAWNPASQDELNEMKEALAEYKDQNGRK